LGWRRPEPGQTTGEGVQVFPPLNFGGLRILIYKVAIKLIRKESVDTKTRMNKIDREIAILRRVHHPNIVKLCDVIYTDRHIGIILEYASGNDSHVTN
jgi:serine/threonine protein kinase